MNKKIKKATLILGAVVTPGLIALTAIACAQPTQPKVEALQGKVKYLAFGDSVAAGYNGEMGFDAPGKMENGVIEGLSYPAFIAKYIQQMDEKRLESFDNYGLSGSTVQDWLYILGDQEYKEGAEKNLNRFLKQDTLEHNPNNVNAGRIAKQFGKMGANPEDFDGFKNKLKEANFMTVSLGANDFLKILYSADLSAIVGASSPEAKAKALEDFTTSLADEGKKIVGNMIRLNNLIRRINPNVKIAYVGYAMPLLRAMPMLDKFLGEIEGNKISTMLLGALNKVVRNGAKLSGHNYVATFDEEDWNKRPELLSKIFFDIHPTGKGYKKMAQEVLLKISLQNSGNSLNYNPYYDRTFEGVEKYNSQWTNNYWSQDQYSFNRLLDLGANAELVKAILGSPKNEKLWEDSDLEKSPTYLEAIAKQKPNVGLALKEFLLNHSGIAKILGNVVLGMISKYDNDGSLAKMLLGKDEGSDKTRISKLLEGIINGKFFAKAVSGIQEEIDSVDLDKNGIPGVQLLSTDVLFGALVKQLTKKANIKDLVEDLLTTKIEGTNQSVLQYLTPILAKMLWSMGMDDKGTVGAFLMAKDSSNLNNLEKLVKTLVSLPAFDLALTKMEQNAALLPKDKLLGFSDLLGLLMSGFKQDYSLMHQLLVQFIKSDFVRTNNEVVKKELSTLLKGLLGKVLESLMSSTSATSSPIDKPSEAVQTSKDEVLLITEEDPELPSAPNPFDNFANVANMLFKPAATQIFLGQLVESLLEDKDNVYSESKTLGTLFQKLIQNNKENVLTWVEELMMNLSRNHDFRQYYYFEATKSVLDYIKEQTVLMKKHRDELLISNPDLYESKNYEEFTPTSQKSINEIKSFVSFALDNTLQYSQKMHSKSKRYPGVKLWVYNILNDNIVNFIDGDLKATKLIDQLKNAISESLKGLLLFIPEDVKNLKKKVFNAQYQEVLAKYAAVKPMVDRFIRGTGF